MDCCSAVLYSYHTFVRLLLLLLNFVVACIHCAVVDTLLPFIAFYHRRSLPFYIKHYSYRHTCCCSPLHSGRSLPMRIHAITTLLQWRMNDWWTFCINFWHGILHLPVGRPESDHRWMPDQVPSNSSSILIVINRHVGMAWYMVILRASRSSAVGLLEWYLHGMVGDGFKMFNRDDRCMYMTCHTILRRSSVAITLHDWSDWRWWPDLVTHVHVKRMSFCSSSSISIYRWHWPVHDRTSDLSIAWSVDLIFNVISIFSSYWYLDWSYQSYIFFTWSFYLFIFMNASGVIFSFSFCLIQSNEQWHGTSQIAWVLISVNRTSSYIKSNEVWWRWSSSSLSSSSFCTSSIFFFLSFCVSGMAPAWHRAWPEYNQ